MESILRVNGGRPLKGTIRVRGAKNFVPKAMVAALLGQTPSILKNVPHVRDVDVVSGLLKLHGVDVNYDENKGIITLDSTNVETAHVADIDAHAGSSRIPILFCGPLLHRLGEAFIPNLGGCQIGDRPIDFHLSTLKKFGATIEKTAKGIYISAPHGLKGAVIELPYPSVGTTEQTLLTAVKAKGITELRGAAVEPEIIDLVAVLQKMGAIISVDIDRVIRIAGVEQLYGYEHTAISDRIEAASWASAALATKGDVFVEGASQLDMTTFLNTFRKVGGKFEVKDNGIRFYHPATVSTSLENDHEKACENSDSAQSSTQETLFSEQTLKSIVLETNVHPGFMTDWQQPLVVALTQAKGMSIVHETVYENRFGFTEALKAMGANIQVYRECLGGLSCRFGQRNFYHSAVISGPSKLTGANIVVPDLRGGFSHLIAALAAEGVSNVKGIDIINRGYEYFLDKLYALNADVELIEQ